MHPSISLFSSSRAPFLSRMGRAAPSHRLRASSPSSNWFGESPILVQKEMMEAQNRQAHMWTLRRYGEFIVEADHIDEPRLKRIEETLGQPIEYAHRVLQRMLDAGMSEEQVVRALRTITDRKILALNSKVNLLGAHMQAALDDLLHDGYSYDAALDFIATHFFYLTLKPAEWARFFHDFFGFELDGPKDAGFSSRLGGENNLVTLSAVSSLVRAHLPGRRPREFLGVPISTLLDEILVAEGRRGKKITPSFLEGELRRWKKLYRAELLRSYGMFY